MNTTRHALFLPVDRDAKYEGKTAIDTFFWRFGDLIQAGVVFVGLNWLGWGAGQFALLSLALAMAWIWLAVAIGRAFAQKAKDNVMNVAPEAGQPIADLHYEPGRPFRHPVSIEAFRDADPGDVLHLTAVLADGRPLPQWVRFDARTREFTGIGPDRHLEDLTIVVVASDVDGMEARSCFVVRRVVAH
jgi:AAA family ATP:ADP antiporter